MKWGGGRRVEPAVDELKLFLNELSAMANILRDIETERNHESVLCDAELARRRMRDRQGDFRQSALALAERHRNALRRVMLPCELEPWLRSVDAVCTSSEPRDFDYDDPDEISETMGQLLTWSMVAGAHRVFAMKLREAMRNIPANEAELQRCTEILLLASDLPVVREHEITTLSLERRRPDFLLRAKGVDLTIELKLCSSADRVGRIQDEIRSDTSFAKEGRRMLFVVYDCGYISNPARYALALAESFQASPNRSVFIEIVKH